MTNNDIDYESYWTEELRGVAFANYNYVENSKNVKSPITYTKIVESKSLNTKDQSNQSTKLIKTTLVV
jgi:hypothetical protein